MFGVLGEFIYNVFIIVYGLKVKSSLEKNTLKLRKLIDEKDYKSALKLVQKMIKDVEENRSVCSR